MDRVFADTSFYVALLSSRDRWHDAAKVCYEYIDCPIVTSEFILLELGALMAKGRARSAYIEFVKQLRSDLASTIVPVSTELLNEGFKLFEMRSDKEWSLVDCVSFYLMSEMKIQHALASDHHFAQAGFEVLVR